MAGAGWVAGQEAQPAGPWEGPSGHPTPCGWGCEEASKAGGGLRVGRVQRPLWVHGQALEPERQTRGCQHREGRSRVRPGLARTAG